MKDPHEVVKAGDVVKVRVTEVDVPRKRIGLTMRKDGAAAPATSREERGKGPAPKARMEAGPSSSGGGAFAEALKGKFGR